MKSTILEYDSTRYNFRKWACELLGVNDLETIHSLNKVKTCNISPTANQLAKSFSSIQKIYKSFVLDVIDNEIGGITNYQSPPSFRFHYSGLGSSVFHRDRDFGVEQGRINVWVPLTNVWGNNSLWIEGKEGAEDHQPITMQFGQILLFDGVNISHGSKSIRHHQLVLVLTSAFFLAEVLLAQYHIEAINDSDIHCKIILARKAHCSSAIDKNHSDELITFC